MIPKIPRSLATPSSDGAIVTEASAAGFPPGVWPELLIVQTELIHPPDFVVKDLNNVYRKQGPISCDYGEEPVLMGYSYVAEGLPELRIWNT